MCNACGKPFRPNDPYLALSRRDGTGTRWHWRCVWVVEKNSGQMFTLSLALSKGEAAEFGRWCAERGVPTHDPQEAWTPDLPELPA